MWFWWRCDYCRTYKYSRPQKTDMYHFLMFFSSRGGGHLKMIQAIRPLKLSSLFFGWWRGGVILRTRPAVRFEFNFQKDMSCSYPQKIWTGPKTTAQSWTKIRLRLTWLLNTDFSIWPHLGFNLTTPGFGIRWSFCCATKTVAFSQVPQGPQGFY